MSRWSLPRAVRSLADVQATDIADDREVYLERLGVVLQEARRASGMKQAEAAAALEMNAATLGRWEHGANKISAYDLVRLVRLYDFDPDLAVNPPSSRIVIRRRLTLVAAAARRAAIRALENPLPEDAGEPE